MSILSVVDNIYAFRLSRLLLTNWEKWDAYKLGLIDDNGERIKDKPLSTSKEKAAWNYFIRAAARIKRLIEKVPGGKNKVVQALATYKLVVSEKMEPSQQEQQVLEFAENLAEAMTVGALGDGDGTQDAGTNLFLAAPPEIIGAGGKKRKKKKPEALKKFTDFTKVD